MRQILAVAVAILYVQMVVSATIKNEFYKSGTCSDAPYKTYTYQTGSCNLGGLVWGCRSKQQCLRYRLYSKTRGSVPSSSVFGLLGALEEQMVPSAEAAVATHQKQQTERLHALLEGLNHHERLVLKQDHMPGGALTAGQIATGSCAGTPSTQGAFLCNRCIGGQYGPSVTFRDCDTSKPRLDLFINGDCSGTSYTHITLPATGCYNSTLDLEVVSCGEVSQTTYQDYNSCSGTVLTHNVFVAGMCSGYMQWKCE